ncbi:ras association domain-containing protein 8-like isoform X2 [Gouania willdenowi]|uniref:ras association domain-containing protein 8-like isoform X2 n=1 Tax=Gouania willdenowi TaxID=441366 RepID=UPI001056ABB7|nr:ras association domain-containing protein 8-like isoform X2 [Gouania willdenowi]
MELKVWVEGIARVISGLTMSTSCQDVVIALAQSIGQTGRYVLILKVRGTERHLVPEECPLQIVAQLGQLAADVHFILQRTGPTLASSTQKRFPPPASPEPLRHRQQQKSLSFSLGPASSNKGRSSPRASPEPRASPVGFLHTTTTTSSKEEVFRQILHQQRKLHDLEVELQALERETELWDQKVSTAVGSDPMMDLTKELEQAELQLRQNEGELIYNQHLDQEFEDELEREREMKRRLNEIHSSIDNQNHEIQATQTRSARLEQQIEARVQSQWAPEEAQQTDEALRPLKQELVHRLQLAEQLDMELWDAHKELHAAEERDRSETIEELNKELRQCKLQHFIQQTGITPQSDPTNPLYLSNAGIKE